MVWNYSVAYWRLWKISKIVDNLQMTEMLGHIVSEGMEVMSY